MPDWSYRTVLKPLLFTLPPATARALCLGVMGPLGRSRAGSLLIDFLGHMRAPAALERRLLGLRFPTPVGLGCDLDPQLRAVHALARFGVGFFELGPVTCEPVASTSSMAVDPQRGCILTADPPEGPGLRVVLRKLASSPALEIPLIARLAVPAGTETARAIAEYRQLLDALAPHVSLFCVPATEAPEVLRDVVAAARQLPTPRPVLARLPLALAAAAIEPLAVAALAAGADGLLLDGALTPSPGRREIGSPARQPARETVAQLRRSCGPDAVIVGSGGVHEAEDALLLLEAGADLVQVDSGLALSGPGLPKRINEALLYAGARPEEDGEASAPPFERSWFWTLLMGAGMLLGSVLALAIAGTRVVLPYDEQFVALSRVELAAVNGRLLAFMAHDRVTLAGTMLTIGALYSALSLFGIRQGRQWARIAVLSSALAGFATFFLFLGFGYFDPFHAFVTAILFQFFLLGLHCRAVEPQGLPAPALREDWRWRLGLWGQLGLIAEATGFIAAGIMICFVGVTQVFVAEDLEFMGTTRAALAAAGPRLIPLVAHDRATFGGMLLVSGLTFLMTSLWGFSRGSRWLWWTILLAGLSGYGAAIGVHYAVGYHSPWHLAPAWAGAALFVTAMALAQPYLCAADPALEEAWKPRRARWSQRGGHPEARA